MYVHLETKQILPDEIALRVALRHISLPLAIKEETVRKFGYATLNDGDKPSPSVYQLVEEAGIEERDGEWFKVWKLVSKPFDDVVEHHPRIIEIKSALKVLDDRSIRPVRALVMRKGGQEDYDVLVKIEKERDDLMTEMNDLIEAINLATRG
ncbi:hypothetical protein D9M68_18240 [compost metagenome]